MATFNAALYSGQIGSAGASLNASSSFPLAQLESGKLRYATIEYALAGTEAAADIINLFRAKIGTKFISSLCRIAHQDLGDALTLDIGFTSNDDALLDGAALGTNAGDVSFTSAGSITATANQYNPAAIASGDERIFATVKTATNLTAGAKLLILLAYIEP